MLKVEPKDGGFLIANKILFAAMVPHEKYVNLAMHKGENLFYEKMPFKLIDFPGEYDIGGILIKAYLGKQNKLSFVFVLNNKRHAIIQTTDVLNNEEVGDMTTWLYIDDKIADRINHMELEGEQQKMENIEEN